MRAPWPAAGSTLTFLQFLPGPANATFSGHLLLGILNPADELVAGQRGDVLPGIESCGIGDQLRAQVSWKFVHDPTGPLAGYSRGDSSGLERSLSPFKRPDRKIENSPSRFEDPSPGRTRRRANRLPNMVEPRHHDTHLLITPAAGSTMSAAPRVRRQRDVEYAMRRFADGRLKPLVTTWPILGEHSQMDW